MDYCDETDGHGSDINNNGPHDISNIGPPQQQAALSMGFSSQFIDDDLGKYRQHIERLEYSLTTLSDEIRPNRYTELRRVLDILGKPCLESEEDVLKHTTTYELQRLISKCHLKIAVSGALATTESTVWWYEVGAILGKYASIFCNRHSPPKRPVRQYEPSFRHIVPEDYLQQLPEPFTKRSPTLKRLLSKLPKGPSIASLTKPLPKQKRYHSRQLAVQNPSAFFWGLFDQVVIELTAIPDSSDEPDSAAHDVSADTIKRQLKWSGERRAFVINGKKVEKFPTALVQSSGWDKETFERNAWVYGECVQGRAYASIVRDLGHHHKEWALIESSQGIRRAAKAFAERLNLEAPPARQSGRPKNSNK